jgi:hypothetical protein
MFLVVLYQRTFQLALNWVITEGTVGSSLASHATTWDASAVAKANPTKKQLVAGTMLTTGKVVPSYSVEQFGPSALANMLRSWTMNLFFGYNNDRTWYTEPGNSVWLASWNARTTLTRRTTG